MGRWRGTGKVAWALILLAASARAQNTTPASVGTEAGLSDLLAARFYLHESYTRDEAPRVGSSEIGGYRVGLRERLVSTRENRQAAPKVEEQISQVFYSERPAAMSPIDGRVTAAIRQYEGAKITPTLPGEKQGLFQGLTIWYQARNGEPPLVIVQNEGRAIQDREYRMASRQLFVPNLALALPEKAIQVGDKYNLSPAGVSTLTGVPAQGGLSGTLQSVQPEEAGSRFRIAVLDIVGDARLPLGQAGVHAQIRF